MAKRLMIVLAVAAVAGGVACASASGGARPGNCDANPRDSVFAAAGPVYHQCAVDRRAQLMNSNVQIDFRPSTPASACYTAEIEFVVAPNGKPETESAQVRRTNNQAFADAVLRSLPAWRYEPAMRGGTPVRQIVTEQKTENTVLVRVRSGEMPHPPSNVMPAPC